MFRSNMGLILGAMAGAAVLGVMGVMLGNTKAARRRRMMKLKIESSFGF